MKDSKTIVLDANILIRAVLGKRVRDLIFQNMTEVKFFAPDVAYADARKYLPALLNIAGYVSPDGVRLCDCLGECVLRPSEPPASLASRSFG
jgi:hypothetical protein